MFAAGVSSLQLLQDNKLLSQVSLVENDCFSFYVHSYDDDDDDYDNDTNDNYNDDDNDD